MQSHFDKRFYGLYRGVVVDNNDPYSRNRLKLRVPQVTGSAVTNWAEECRSGNFLSHDVPNGAHDRLIDNTTTTDVSVGTTGGSATLVNFTANELGGGVYIDSSVASRIRVSKPGTYFFGVNLQVYYGGAGADQTFLSWFNKNGTNVEGSTKRTTLKGANHYTNFFLSTTQTLTTADYLETQCLGSDSNFTLRYVGSGTGPDRPSSYRAIMNTFCVSGNLPAVGSGVWVMYEGGDPNFPVWMGAF